MSTSKINWSQVKGSLPKTAGPLLEEMKQIYEAGGEDPARGVELALREKVAKLRLRFDAIKEKAP
jgi:hypothetical protein